MAEELAAYQIRITGIVQGVGFRPFVSTGPQYPQGMGTQLVGRGGYRSGDRDELQEFAILW